MKTKRGHAQDVAQTLEFKQKSTKQILGLPLNPQKVAQSEKKEGMKFWTIRALPKKFGISFIIPDRMATEINDKKKIRGARPLRITRIPSGGPREFHEYVMEAERECQPLKNCEFGKSPNPRRLYHRNRLNDWHTQVFYDIFDGNEYS